MRLAHHPSENPGKVSQTGREEGRDVVSTASRFKKKKSKIFADVPLSEF
jgi:hypothetical protein